MRYGDSRQSSRTSRQCHLLLQSAEVPLSIAWFISRRQARVCGETIVHTYGVAAASAVATNCKRFLPVEGRVQRRMKPKKRNRPQRRPAELNPRVTRAGNN